jgi:hypothetical protein
MSSLRWLVGEMMEYHQRKLVDGSDPTKELSRHGCFLRLLLSSFTFQPLGWIGTIHELPLVVFPQHAGRSSGD